MSMLSSRYWGTPLSICYDRVNGDGTANVERPQLALKLSLGFHTTCGPTLNQDRGLGLHLWVTD